jgi:hypothetical protein
MNVLKPSTILMRAVSIVGEAEKNKELVFACNSILTVVGEYLKSQGRLSDNFNQTSCWKARAEIKSSEEYKAAMSYFSLFKPGWMVLWDIEAGNADESSYAWFDLGASFWTERILALSTAAAIAKSESN